MFRYDTSEHPPAANVTVTVTDPLTGNQIVLPGKIEMLKVTASPRSQMLIGRDVLSHFVATFDGKNLTFDLVDP